MWTGFETGKYSHPVLRAMYQGPALKAVQLNRPWNKDQTFTSHWLYI